MLCVNFKGWTQVAGSLHRAGRGLGRLGGVGGEGAGPSVKGSVSAFQARFESNRTGPDVFVVCLELLTHLL